MNNNRNSMTLCYIGKLSYNANRATATITFNEPYIWYGGNLIIDTYVYESGSYYTNNSFAWYGKTGYSTGVSINNYYTGSGSTANTLKFQFLPKMTITYTSKVASGSQTKAHVTYDRPFFESKTYNWTDSTGQSHTNNLAEIATDPDQIIAMMRKIYTDPEIPGNLKRGYGTDGTKAFDEPYNDVYYAGVGTPNLSNDTFVFEDYGWDIEGNLDTWRYSHNTNSGTQYSYVSTVDTVQYKPDYDGLTVLLVELVDDYSYSKLVQEYNATTINSAKERLRFFMKKTIKSARIISEAKRTGADLDRGTLFKVDCDKMNKFFFLAKGQLRWVLNSFEAESEDTYTGSDGKTHNYILGTTWCAPPCFIYSDYYNTHTIADNYGYLMFFHMFEQFSPVATDATAGLDDIYQGLVNMDSYGVDHDCASIPNLNHQFMMYGEDSEAKDCQDVRDLMFFVPDYRMMKWKPATVTEEVYGRDPAMFEKYLNYNKEHQPKMGLYVIRQNEITGVQVGTDADSLYRLNLNWVSNLDNFLPGDEQEFELFQVVVDDDGNETYVPVYYRNANGEYTDSLGNVLADQSNPVPIKLYLGAGAEKNYPDVFVDMQTNSQMVTYAIRGRDKGHFLGLKMSNQQSYVIPGLDKNEKLVLNDATYYSRYNPDTQKNCYSNKLVITNDDLGLRVNDLQGGSAGANATRLDVYRMHNELVEGESQTVKELVVSLKVGNKNERRMDVTWGEQADSTEFPIGKSDANKPSQIHAGYHVNSIGSTYNYNTKTTNGVQYVVFNNLVIYDNFTADVSENQHPGLYQYKIETNYTDETITEGSAYSNTYRVPVYKTMSQISGSFTKEEVDADVEFPTIGLLPSVEFGAQLRYSSKTEILRYDAYRWNADEERFIIDEVYENDSEQDLPPTGMAGNQDGSYTVSMNDVLNQPEYYTTSTVAVAPGETDKWANFVDKYAESNPGAYVYAPVIETFATGKDANGNVRRDYNTYGGPLQNAATGRIDVTLRDAQKGSYTFRNDDGVAYTYYTMALDWKAIVDNIQLIPRGYDIYKIRAWRKIDPQYLGEELSDRQARMGNDNGEYLFEEFTYLDVNKTDPAPALGNITVGPNNEKSGTFGAIDVNAPGSPVTEIPVTFVVRLYFTSMAELATLPTPSFQPGTPRRAGETADGKYYISEIEINTTLKGGSDQIVTAVNDLNYREVEQVIYYNTTGMASSKPFAGVNVVVTRYTDGTTVTSKQVR